MSEGSFHTEIMDLTGKKYVRTYKNTILIVEYRKFDRFYILLSLREPGRPCIIGFVKILNRKSPATQTEPQTAADGGAFGGDAVKQVGRTDYPMFGQKLRELGTLTHEVKAGSKKVRKTREKMESRAEN